MEIPMAYDLNLTNRIRNLLESNRNIIERKMFGGVGFILHGNMACVILGNDLIVRVGSENWDSLITLPFVHPFMGNTGKPMKG